MNTNFDDIEFQIIINKERLQDEYQREKELRSRLGIVVIFYSIFSAYLIQLIKYLFEKHISDSWYFLIFFICYLFLFFISIINTYKYLLPKARAHIHLPEFYYKDVRQQYVDKKVDRDIIKNYLRKGYLEEIEKSLKINFKLNNEKSECISKSFNFALLALIPYVLCIGVRLNEGKDKIIKVKIINNIKSINMSETNDDQPIDPNVYITIDPIMVKGGAELPVKK